MLAQPQVRYWSELYLWGHLEPQLLCWHWDRHVKFPNSLQDPGKTCTAPMSKINLPFEDKGRVSASKMEVSVRAISHSKGRFLFVFALQDQVIPGFSFDGPKGITSSCCLRSDMVMAGCLGFHHVLHGATALPCALARSTRCKSCVDALRKQVPANLDLTGKLVLFMIKIVLGNLIKDWELTGTPCMDWYRSIMIYI